MSSITDLENILNNQNIIFDTHNLKRLIQTATDITKDLYRNGYGSNLDPKIITIKNFNNRLKEYLKQNILPDKDDICILCNNIPCLEKEILQYMIEKNIKISDDNGKEIFKSHLSFSNSKYSSDYLNSKNIMEKIIYIYPIIEFGDNCVSQITSHIKHYDKILIQLLNVGIHISDKQFQKICNSMQEKKLITIIKLMIDNNDFNESHMKCLIQNGLFEKQIIKILESKKYLFSQECFYELFKNDKRIHHGHHNYFTIENMQIFINNGCIIDHEVLSLLITMEPSYSINRNIKEIFTNQKIDNIDLIYILYLYCNYSDASPQIIDLFAKHGCLPDNGCLEIATSKLNIELTKHLINKYNLELSSKNFSDVISQIGDINIRKSLILTINNMKKMKI